MNCFLVAAFDALLLHPAGTELLKRIQVEFNKKKVRVKFPAQPWVTMRFTELDSGAGSNYPGIVIVEKAYEKLGANMNFDSPEKALQFIFGEDCPDLRFQHNAKTAVIGSIIHPLPREDVFERGVRHYMERAATDSPGVDIITAEPNVAFNVRGKAKVFAPGHIYSVRLAEGTREAVAIADPFNTSASYYISSEWFPRVFNVGVVRLPRPTVSHQPLAPVAPAAGSLEIARPEPSSLGKPDMPVSQGNEAPSPDNQIPPSEIPLETEEALMERLFDPAVMPSDGEALGQPAARSRPEGSALVLRERIYKGRGLSQPPPDGIIPPIRSRASKPARPPYWQEGMGDYLKYHAQRQWRKFRQRLGELGKT